MGLSLAFALTLSACSSQDEAPAEGASTPASSAIASEPSSEGDTSDSDGSAAGAATPSEGQVIDYNPLTSIETAESDLERAAYTALAFE